jgi:apolipoprotein N-acyltransferase
MLRAPAFPAPFRRPDSIISRLDSFPLRLAAAALSGALLVACFPRLDLHFLVWIACLPLLLALLSEPRLLRAFFLGYACGAVFWLGCCYWFVIVMETYGDLSSPLALAVLALFTVVFSVFFAGFALVEAWVGRYSAPLALALSPFLWVAMELARTYLITGFPWNLLGYAVHPTGLRQVASVTAVYGLSFLAVATSALAGWVLVAKRKRRASLALAAWLILLVAGNAILNYATRLPAPATNAAFLLQPDVPLDQSALQGWAPWRNPEDLDRLVNDTLRAACAGVPSVVQNGLPDCAAAWSRPGVPPPLLVWSENPAPFYYPRDPVFTARVRALAQRAHAHLVFNTITFLGANESRPQNAAIVLDPAGQEILRYDKIHLVPFGEYVPWWAFPGKTGRITFQVGDFVPGTSYRVAPTPQGGIGVFICYEDIFPQLVRQIARAGAGVLVNITDDAWYGDSPAAFQHFEMARFRAIENRRYLLRSTNDGITAIIDPRGEIVAQLPRHGTRVLDGKFRYLHGESFYTAHGDVFAWLCVALSGILSVLALGRPKTRKQF